MAFQSWMTEDHRLNRRFWSMVNISDGCWEWQGHIGVGGYGVISRYGIKVSAHQMAYRLEVGEIPDGLVLDHLCGNRQCCRPDHLEAVTIKVNCRRGMRVVHECVRGHDTSSPHARIPRSNRCRKCARLDNQAYQRRRAAPAM